MYIRRTSEDVIKKLSKQFKVVLVTGVRQVGKSYKIMLKHFNVLDNQGYGGLICMRESDIPLTEDVSAIPISYI